MWRFGLSPVRDGFMNKRQTEWSSQKGDAFSRFAANIGKVVGGAAKKGDAGKAKVKNKKKK
jgi:hypothetical protein